jgi:hypothetical protein
MVSAKNGWYASQILRAAKRTNTFIQVIFFWVASDPRMLQVSKELHGLLSRPLSGRLVGKAKCTNADDVRMRQRHTPLVRQSRHIRNVIYVVMTS